MAYLLIGVDVGLTGGISILKDNNLPIVYKIPVKSIIVNKKNKKTYDLEKIVDIFDEYNNDNDVLFFIEKQNVRRGEGSVSAMTIGKGYGQLLGIAAAFRFDIIEVTPQTWKKSFPELITREMDRIKIEMKDLRLIGKKIKGKKAKNENKKQVDKLGRQFKSSAKDEARALVSRLYPSLSDMFIKKNTDGIAESVLISIYGKDTFTKGQTK